MSKYQKIYETLCPNDILSKDDPRRSLIIEEMKSIHHAKTEADAVAVIEWWNAWPNPQHESALEFVQEARKLLQPAEAK